MAVQVKEAHRIATAAELQKEIKFVSKKRQIQSFENHIFLPNWSDFVFLIFPASHQFHPHSIERVPPYRNKLQPTHVLLN